MRSINKFMFSIINKDWFNLTLILVKVVWLENIVNTLTLLYALRWVADGSYC